jgi:phage terminase small subunit
METNLPDQLMDDALAEPDEETRTQLILTADQRKEYLGKLADFEMKLSELPPMQAAFVLAVLRDPTNYTKAARVAGYKGPPAIAANKCLHKPAVAACIALGEQLREDRTMITNDRVLHEFAIIAFSDIVHFTVDPHTGHVTVKDGVPAYATRAISSIEFDTTSWTEDGETHTRVKTKIKLWSKNDALKMLAMYQHLLSGENGANLVIDNSRHVHMHQHQHNTWAFGDQMITF